MHMRTIPEWNSRAAEAINQLSVEEVRSSQYGFFFISDSDSVTSISYFLPFTSAVMGKPLQRLSHLGKIYLLTYVHFICRIFSVGRPESSRN